MGSQGINLGTGEEDEDENFEQLLGCAEAIAIHSAQTFVEIGSRAADDEIGSGDDDHAGTPSEQHRGDEALGDSDSDPVVARVEENA